MIAKNRVALGWVLALVVLYLADPTPRSIVVGTPVAVLGLAIRALAAGTIRKGRELTRTGPYAFTRNPLYLGSSLLAAGFAIMSASLPAALLLLVPSALVYPLVIREEEAFLRGQYGTQFDEFRKLVPCFLPRRINRNALQGVTLRQFMVNGEYNATIGFLAATGVLALKLLLPGT